MKTEVIKILMLHKLRNSERWTSASLGRQQRSRTALKRTPQVDAVSQNVNHENDQILRFEIYFSLTGSLAAARRQ